jgi:hypothetical protein
VDGWNVWNNATISENSRVETGEVPVRIDLSSHQTLWAGASTSIRIDGQRILVEKGSALLDQAGLYSLVAKSKSGLAAGSDPAEMSRAAQIPRLYESRRELRATSQRP